MNSSTFMNLFSNVYTFIFTTNIKLSLNWFSKLQFFKSIKYFTQLITHGKIWKVIKNSYVSKLKFSNCIKRIKNKYFFLIDC